MRSLIFTYYESLYSTSGDPLEKYWEDWIKTFSKPRIVNVDDSDKTALEKIKDGPGLVFGSIDPGGPHKNDAVNDIHALCLDIDDKSDEEIDEVLSKLERYEYIIYSTLKHNARCLEKNKTRIRVVFPLLEPISKNQYTSLWKKFNILTGKITDKQTKNAGRVYYLPTTFNEEFFIFYNNKGDWLSIEDLRLVNDVEITDIDRLKKLLQYMPKSTISEDGKNLKDIAQKLLAGEKFSDEGDRHNTILKLTMWIAQKTILDPISIESVLQLFKPSIEVMQSIESNSPDLDDVERCYISALDKVQLYIEKEEKKRETKVIEKQLRGQDPYSVNDLENISKKQNIQSDKLVRRWIIQKDHAFYFLDEDGEYKGPYSTNEARPAAMSILSRAPILLNEITKAGYRRKTIQELVEEYGSVAREIITDLTRSYSFFDERYQIIYESPRPIRNDLVPKYDSLFDEYLKILAGNQYEKLCDWIACVPDLNKLLCALYLGGHPGAMKTFLAFGLAKLWHDGPPSSIERILADFNDDLLRCPLILADEALPKHWRGMDITTKLRSMISITQSTLARKYLPGSTLNGAIRLILTGNNEFLLNSSQVLSSDDLQAVAQRFLYIKSSVETKDFVEKLSKEVKDMWFLKGIAEHALYLKENRSVVPGKRFWVEGEISIMHRLLISGSDYNSMICQWLTKYLMNPKRIDQLDDGLVRIKDQQLLVSDQGIIDHWYVFFPNTKIEPISSKIGAALRAICTNEKLQLRYKNVRIRYRIVDLDNLFAWVENSNIGDLKLMKINLGLEKDDEENVLPINEKTTPLYNKIKNKTNIGKF